MTSWVDVALQAEGLKAEKAAVKRDNIEAVTKWRKDNVERRKGGLADGDDDLDRIMGDGGGAGGASRKRKSLDRKVCSHAPILPRAKHAQA